MKNNSESDTSLSEVSMDKFPVNQRPDRSDYLSEKSISGSINCDSNYRYSNRSDHDEGRPVAPNKYRIYSHVTTDNWDVENNDDMKTTRSEFGNARMRAQIGADRYQRSQHSPDWRHIGERGDGGVRFLDSHYPYEGPSNNYSGTSYGRYEKVLNNPNGSSDDYTRLEYLEQDRAQLLRKLEELDNQLNRSCQVVEKPKDKVVLDGRMFPQDPYFGTGARFPGASTSSTTSSMRSFAHDNHVSKPPYNHHYPDPDPYVNRRERGMHGLYYQPPNYGDPSQYQQQPSHPYFSRQYIDTHLTPFEPHIHNHISHHPSCSCTYCYDNDQQAPPTMPNSTFRNDPTLYNRKHVSQSSSHDTQSLKRWSSDVNSDMGGSGKSHPQRVLIANNGRSCRPVGGGSPFITCCNCFELLQFPKKLRTWNKQKIKCGACLVVLSCSVLDKKLVISVCVETKQTVTSVVNNSGEVLKPSYDHTNQDIDNFLSDDFDSSGYDIPPPVIAHNESLSDHDFNSSKTEEKQGIHASSANSSKDEDSPDGLKGRKEVVNSIDLQNKPTLSPLPPGSSLQEYFDYSSNNHRKQSSPSVQKKVMKSPSVATEMEVSFNEYSHTRSVDSGDTILEEVTPKFNHNKDDVKKNIESNDIVEDGKSSVKINGRPLPSHLVKKAERLAGPIRPGQYWYDYRAGFWGVIDGPCLGIIPPYIEEFNYPMREDCAGGDTSVFVNGRELHQKDLKLLMRRGLPPGRDRSYVIDITGKVLDEDTGDELDGLGKLAPT